jgi:hypothetical protein
MYVALPRQVVQYTLIFPLVSILNQICPDRIGSGIFPFLMVVFIAAQPMMETARLKSRRTYAAPTPKLPLPENDPLLNRDFFLLRRAEKMDVIGHNHVPTDQPCVSLSPSFHESLMIGFLSKR